MYVLYIHVLYSYILRFVNRHGRDGEAVAVTRVGIRWQ